MEKENKVDGKKLTEAVADKVSASGKNGKMPQPKKATVTTAPKLAAADRKFLKTECPSCRAEVGKPCTRVPGVICEARKDRYGYKKLKQDD